MLIFNVHNGLSTMQFDFSGWDCIYLIFKGIPFDPAEALQPFMDILKTSQSNKCLLRQRPHKLFLIVASLTW